MEIVVKNKNGEFKVEGCNYLVLFDDGSGHIYNDFSEADELAKETDFWLVSGDKLIINGIVFPFED